jgi:putative membrane protein
VHYYYMNGGWPWGMWLFMGLFTVVVAGLVVWAVVVLSQHRGGPQTGPLPPPAPPIPPSAGPDPKGILDERYARGEIDETEYRRRLAVLQGRD